MKLLAEFLFFIKYIYVFFLYFIFFSLLFIYIYVYIYKQIYINEIYDGNSKLYIGVICEKEDWWCNEIYFWQV